jgi:hypothetical protein
MLKTLCFTLVALTSGGAAAQESAKPGSEDPKLAVPSRPGESAFRDYRPYDDPELAGWRASNDEMGRLGGHLGHVPKAQGPTPKPAAKPPSAQGGHRSHQ